ncbi:hypothetical protein SHIRM173S_02223 [Streptomyces hirsutus]
MPIFYRCPGHLGHDVKFGQIGDLRDLAGNHPFRIVIRLPPERRGMQDPAMSTTDVFSRRCHVGRPAWDDLGVDRAGEDSLVSSAPPYQGHRYPVEIISHCVRLYHRFPLSFREVEELMLERGVLVSHETIRRWCAKFGQVYANGLRRRRPRPGDTWCLDEVFIKINGGLKYLWRTVDADDTVLDLLVRG